METEKPGRPKTDDRRRRTKSELKYNDGRPASCSAVQDEARSRAAMQLLTSLVILKSGTRGRACRAGTTLTLKSRTDVTSCPSCNRTAVVQQRPWCSMHCSVQCGEPVEAEFSIQIRHLVLPAALLRSSNTGTVWLALFRNRSTHLQVNLEKSGNPADLADLLHVFTDLAVYHLGLRLGACFCVSRAPARRAIEQPAPGAVHRSREADTYRAISMLRASVHCACVFWAWRCIEGWRQGRRVLQAKTS